MLISEEYKKVLSDTHKKYGGRWGSTAPRYTDRIIEDIKLSGFREVLDYGSADGSFRKSLTTEQSREIVSLLEYDPGYEQRKDNNIPRDYVICIDVLEHIEPEALEDVLDDLQRCTLERGFFTVCTVEATHILSDGRNCHLIVEPVDWWVEKFEKRFDIMSKDVKERNFSVIVAPK